MSVNRVINIECSHCHHQQTVEIWDLINISDNHELKEKVLNGQIFLNTCDNCKHQLVYDYPCLYLDIEHNYTVYLQPAYDPKSAKQYSELMNMLKANFIDPDLDMRNRLVMNNLRLIEKIQLFDHGYDDHIMEIYKYLHQGKIIKEHPNTINIQAYYVVDGDSEFIIYVTDNDTYKIKLNKSLYHDIYDDFKGKINIDNNFVKIDEDWVKDLIKIEYDRKEMK